MGSRPGAKRARVMALCHAQGWRCWICGHLMAPPVTGGSNPPRFAATLDHLTPRARGELRAPPRPAKAAHRFCNQVRHHGAGLTEKHRQVVARLFSDPVWVKQAGIVMQELS